MGTVLEIIHVETWKTEGKIHTRSHLILEDGEEAQGYGEFKIGEQVDGPFFHKGVIKVQKKVDK